MKLRIALWASAGFVVACCWALYAAATGPLTNERIRDVWALVVLTCPIVVTRSYFPLSLYVVLVANAGTYALLGLLVETLRRHLDTSTVHAQK